MSKTILSYGPKVANKGINHELLANQSELARVIKQRDAALLQCGQNIAHIDKLRNQRDAAVAALRGVVAAFNVKDIDPLQAFVAIEQAQGAIAATTQPRSTREKGQARQ